MHIRPIRLSVLVFVIVLGIAPPLSASTPVATPAPSGLDTVIPTYQTSFADRIASFPRYDLDLALDPARSTLGGTVSLTYPNATGETLTELPLRLYPNADYYLEGETSIASIVIDGRAVAPRFDTSGTVLFVDLPDPLPAGETLTVAIAFTTVVPRNSSGSYGILNHDLASGDFVLADWYPVVAGYDETGWRLEPPTYHGDPTFSATGVFDVRLTVPDGYTVIASGTETVLDDGTVLIESGPVREFAMVVLADLTSFSQMFGETDITVSVAPGHDVNGQHMLDLAARGLRFYNDALGAYPFDELDIVETPLSLAYGVSWSGILFIDDSQLALSPDLFASLDFTLLHEIGHQWWGGTVGANSNDHTWMVEGLTNATAVLAQSALQGNAAAVDSLYVWIVSPYLNLLSGMGDGVADVSIFGLPDGMPISTLAYSKGALGFLAIRNQIGAGAFLEALASYANDHRLGIADPDDLLAAFEAASGQSLSDLWTFWFESAETTPADVEALVAQVVATL